MFKGFNRESVLDTGKRLAHLEASGEHCKRFQWQKEKIREDYGIEIDEKNGTARYIENK